MPATVTDWVDSLAAITADTNPIEALAAAHAAFERTHPFLDGNGRTGRLLRNLLLVRLGYPPAIIYTRDRNRYLGPYDEPTAVIPVLSVSSSPDQ